MNHPKLPQTDSIEELAKFWQTHDLTDFGVELEQVTESVFVKNNKRGTSMSSITVAEIDERLRQLPAEKLPVVYDFVSYLLERDLADLGSTADSDVRDVMFASETVLGQDWNRPEEDAAWADL